MKRIHYVTVIGAGIMGSGIAQSIFKYGCDVTLYDTDSSAISRAVDMIRSKARRNRSPDMVRGASDLNEALDHCDLLIEAVFEDLDVKCEIFDRLGKISGRETIFATNTSSLSISKMAEAAGRTDRFLGLHFFNPPLIMRLVEVIGQPDLDREVLDSVLDFISAIKKQAVFCRESPGFIVNRILLPVINEAFFILQKHIDEGEDEIEAANRIDSAITSEGILLMGPYDLADLTGLDTIDHVSTIIFEGFGRSPRYAKAPLLEKHFNAGHLGRKSGRGIYYYGNHKNDPDLNPRLSAQGQALPESPTGDFDTLDFVSVIVNEAFRMVEEGIVDDFESIELAMELGIRWPKGPFRLAKEIGPDIVRKRLEELYAQSGRTPRYEPSRLFDDLPPSISEYFNREKTSS